jgi:NAD dependent epimerase/dehydratase family enzyme
VDYNQATKRFNSLVKQKRADGSPVINARAANYYLHQLKTMTQELKQAMDHIIEMVANLELKQTAPQEQINNN